MLNDARKPSFLLGYFFFFTTDVTKVYLSRFLFGTITCLFSFNQLGIQPQGSVLRELTQGRQGLRLEAKARAPPVPFSEEWIGTVWSTYAA
jgi:hypothetical protein